MIVDMQLITPYLVALLTAVLAFTGFYFRSLGHKLSDITTKIAILIEHNNTTDGDIIDIKKYHTEIIDHKVLIAELNERTLTTRAQVSVIQTRLDELDKYHNE